MASPTGACLTLPRVLSLVAGLALVAAFPMPWFSTQGLLLSGQFLDSFLARPSDLGRFLPGVSTTEAQALRVLVDAFPACGLVVALASLVGGLVRRTALVADVVTAIAALVPLIGWTVGVGRLPAGSALEIGLQLMPVAAVAAPVGIALDRLTGRRRDVVSSAGS